MNCLIYRSEKKLGAYLYLATEKTLEDVPDELTQLLGQCVQIMKLDLSRHHKLATEDIDTVKKNLKDQGYHLQMPPNNQASVISYGI